MRHRFHSICPYFAMFPEQFAEQWINECTKPGQTVLDPFSGRGTAPFQALLMDRHGIAGDVNPVAFVLSGAKLESPSLQGVRDRINQLENDFDPDHHETARKHLPPFFGRAFHRDTLRQILFLRQQLAWKTSEVDRFLAALALGALHGDMNKAGSYLSNQMPRTISTKPTYSLKFWRTRGLWPKKRNAFQVLRDRAAFRYESPPPPMRGKAFLNDARDLGSVASVAQGSVDCVITSPPYLDVTNFEEDQWLRLWFLGGLPRPTKGEYSRDDRHQRVSAYWAFLEEAWRGIRPLLAPRARFICRIGGRSVVVEALREALNASMKFLANRWEMLKCEVSQLQRRQTDAFRPGSVGCRFEVDFCFELTQ